MTFSRAIHSQDNCSSRHSWSLKCPLTNLAEELSLYLKSGAKPDVPFIAITATCVISASDPHHPMWSCPERVAVKGVTPARRRSPALREARPMIHPGSVKYKHTDSTNPSNTHTYIPPPSVIKQYGAQGAAGGLVLRKNT